MNQIFFGDCRATMRQLIAQGVKVQTCVTSPPYFGLRDYGHAGQLGLEETPDVFVANLVEVFRLVRDLLAFDGTLWLNLGDSYGDKKQLLGIPWRVAFALQADGWYLRQDIIWHKPNPMPESVTDRCTKAHEYIFLLSKSPKYFYDHEAIKVSGKNPADDLRRMAQQKTDNKSMPDEKVNGLRPKRDSFKREKSKRGIPMIGQSCGTHRPNREESKYVIGMANRRSVWTVSTKPYKGSHFATFPTDLITPCVLAGSRPGDIVFDPFMGSGTTAQVAIENGRQYLGCELNEEYGKLQRNRLNGVQIRMT